MHSFTCRQLILALVSISESLPVFLLFFVVQRSPHDWANLADTRYILFLTSLDFEDSVLPVACLTLVASLLARLRFFSPRQNAL